MKNILYSLICIFSLNSIVLADITSGLIAHYEFEENLDDTTNTYDLSIAAGGTAAYSSTGKFGNSYLFNGSDNYLKTLDNAIPEGTSATISFWVKDTVDSGQAYVGMQNNSGATTYNPVIYTDGSQNLGAYGNTHEYPANQSGIGTIMFDGSWHHVVLTFSGAGTATFYFDGAYVTPLDSSADDFKLGTRIFIGAQLNNNVTPANFFAGEMDDIRIYDRALSSSDIAELYSYNLSNNRYLEIEESITLTEYDNNTSLAISIPFDFYWLDSYEKYDSNNESFTTTIEAGQILFSNDGILSEIDKTFDSNSSRKNTYDDMNYTISNNHITVKDSNTNESLFEFKLAETYTSSELTTIYSSYNMDINFSSEAVGYKILGKTLKEEIEVHNIIFDYEQNPYTSIDTYLINHTLSGLKYLMINDINNSKLLYLDQNASDQNVTSGTLNEVDIDTQQIINYTAGTWERITDANISYEYDNNGTTVTGTTNDMVLIKPTELGYNYDDAIILGSDGYLHQASYRDINSTESFIHMNSFAVNDIAKSIVNDTNIDVTFEGQNDSEVFQNTHSAYNELFYIRTDDDIHQDNNITYDSTNEIFTITANKKDGLDSRANLRVYFSDINETIGVSADVNLTNANTSNNTGHMWAVLKDVKVTGSNDLNISNGIAHIYAGITVKGNGIFNYITVYDENWTETWNIGTHSEYNTRMLYDSNSTFMLNKKVKLNISINNNTLLFEAFDENNNILGNKHKYNNLYLNIDAIDRTELRTRVDDSSFSAGDTTTMKVYNFSKLSHDEISNIAPYFNQNITNISVTEGTTSVVTLSASDADNDSLTYSLSGMDDSLFSIDNIGTITFNNIPDYEAPVDYNSDNIYDITVNVTDGYRNDTQNITITVTDDLQSPQTLIGSSWEKGEFDYQYTSSTATDYSTYSTLNITKIPGNNSILQISQDNLGTMVESSIDIDMKSIDENTYISVFLTDTNGYMTQIILTSKSAAAVLFLNQTPIQSGTIYDNDGTNYFSSKRIKLNTWFLNDGIHFNITDTNNNQLGREVILPNNATNTMTSFTAHKLTALLSDTSNSANDAIEMDLHDASSNPSINYDYYKRLPHLEFKIPLSTYNSAVAQDLNNTQLFQIRTNVDWNDTEYLNLKFGQIYPLDTKIMESDITINHKAIVTHDKKEISTISKTGDIVTLNDDSNVAHEEIKYQGSIDYMEMNDILSDANLSFNLTTGGGHKVYSKKLQTVCKIQGSDSSNSYTNINSLMDDYEETNTYNNYISANNFNNLKVLQFNSTISGQLIEHDRSSSRGDVYAGTWSVTNNISCDNDGTNITIDIIDINSTINGYEDVAIGYKSGTKYNIEYTKENDTRVMYFYDKNSSLEMTEEYRLTTTPVKQIDLNNTYNYLSLPSSITLCTSAFQSVLTSICNQDYDIETIFSQVDTLFKYDGSWSYWEPNISLSTSYKDLDILSTINNREGFIAKISGSAKTLYLPYNLYNTIETEVIELYKDGWYLAGTQTEYSTSNIEEKVLRQGKTLKYMLHLNDNVWNVHAPLNDADVDSAIPRMSTVKEGESFWIYVE